MTAHDENGSSLPAWLASCHAIANSARCDTFGSPRKSCDTGGQWCSWEGS